MKIIKIFLNIIKFIFTAILAVVLLLNLFAVAKGILLAEEIPLVLGFGKAVIISGSMEPAIAPGDVIIIHKQSSYQPGDIVTFKSHSYITHRIVEKTPTGYITQGDANNARDAEIDPSRIVGRTIKIIPKAGDVILFLQSPFGIAILIFCLFLMIEISRFKKNKNKGDT